MEELPANAVRVTSAEEFKDIVRSGHEEFFVGYTDGDRQLYQSAPFDMDDPMSYILAGIFFADPNAQVYKV